MHVIYASILAYGMPNVGMHSSCLLLPWIALLGLLHVCSMLMMLHSFAETINIAPGRVPCAQDRSTIKQAILLQHSAGSQETKPYTDKHLL